MAVQVQIHKAREILRHLPRLEAYVLRPGQVPLSRHPAWLWVLKHGLKHTPYCLEAVEGDQTRGWLPLVLVHSWLFGRYLVSLPYLNYGGVTADDPDTTRALIDRAVMLADRLRVRYLELRQERALDHPALSQRLTGKLHMRLELPATAEQLWESLPAKVRNQVRKGGKSGLTVLWGGLELLPEFYAVFSRNMRDLGTPVYGVELFAAILRHFPQRAELGIVRTEKRAIAGAILLHGWGVSEAPSAGSLRSDRASNANMLLYWHMLERAVARGQSVFDFGRSTADSNTYRFKKQWGACAEPAEWQYHVREGSMTEMRPENPRFRPLIRIWQRLPVGLTRVIGPMIVRGIP